MAVGPEESNAEGIYGKGEERVEKILNLLENWLTFYEFSLKDHHKMAKILHNLFRY